TCGTSIPPCALIHSTSSYDIFPPHSTSNFSLYVFLNDPAPTEIYTLSLHDALPIFPNCAGRKARRPSKRIRRFPGRKGRPASPPDRKSTRLNSSHVKISYAVFCLKKKKKK